jgi:predicted nuclease with TOPRIM domain
LSFNYYQNMANLEEVYTRLSINKKKASELRKMLQDELAHNARYGELKDQVKVLKEEMKSLENEVKLNSKAELDQLEDLKEEIKTDLELISDIALNMYINDQSVEIVDEYNNKWFPQFKVSFKKQN